MQNLAEDVLDFLGDDGDVGMAAESEEEEESHRIVSTRDLRRELGEASRKNEVCLIYTYYDMPVAHFVPAC